MLWIVWMGHLVNGENPFLSYTPRSQQGELPSLIFLSRPLTF